MAGATRRYTRLSAAEQLQEDAAPGAEAAGPANNNAGVGPRGGGSARGEGGGGAPGLSPSILREREAQLETRMKQREARKAVRDNIESGTKTMAQTSFHTLNCRLRPLPSFFFTCRYRSARIGPGFEGRKLSSSPPCTAPPFPPPPAFWFVAALGLLYYGDGEDHLLRVRGRV